MKKRCPLMSHQHDQSVSECLEEFCAFWHKGKEQCSIPLIAEHLDSLANIQGLIADTIPAQRR